jgi:hypothetical protein
MVYGEIVHVEMVRGEIIHVEIVRVEMVRGEMVIRESMLNPTIDWFECRLSGNIQEKTVRVPATILVPQKSSELSGGWQHCPNHLLDN